MAIDRRCSIQRALALRQPVLSDQLPLANVAHAGRPTGPLFVSLSRAHAGRPGTGRW